MRTIAHRNASEDLLLVIDFQNVYLPGGDWACPAMPEAMRSTRKILDAPNAPDFVLTRYIAPEAPVGRWKRYNEVYREINENSFLSRFPAALDGYAAKAPVAEKSTYSSMKAPGVRTALEGKKAVVLTGVVAECCVLATMFDAIDLGYEVVYLYDCIAGQTAEAEEWTRKLAELYEPVHTTVMCSDEYLKAITEA